MKTEINLTGIVMKNPVMTASGISGFSYYSNFIHELMKREVSSEFIDNITHNNIINIFGFIADAIPNTRGASTKSLHYFRKLPDEYPFDPLY